MKRLLFVGIALAVSLAVGWARVPQAWGTGLTPEARCEADKNKIAGKYAFCRQKAEAKAIKKNTEPDYSKCDGKFTDKWGKAETKGGGLCPTNGDLAAMQAYVTQHAVNVAAALDGGGLVPCGPALLASGQTSCYLNGAVVPCAAAPGQDGQVQAGAALSYTDNGDGTITDNNTGLMWEKKSDDGSLHDWGNAYFFSSTCSITGFECLTNSQCPDVLGTPQTCTGTTIFEWVAQVNAEGGTGFAGYSDWRIPNVRELGSILNHENDSPSVSPAFNTGCGPGCTVTSCSCTQLGGYWTSTTPSDSPITAFAVDFGFGGPGSDGTKDSLGSVRAVRGGL